MTSSFSLLLTSSLKQLRQVQLTPLISQLRQNSLWCSYSYQKRKHFPRMYKTIAILEDGSTITIRQKTPMAYIQYPVDVSVLSEKERRDLWVDRKRGSQTDYQSTVEEKVFDESQYQQYFKK